MDCDCLSFARLGTLLKNGHAQFCPKAIVLHVFKNDSDSFVAETAEEAADIYRQFVKNTGVEDDCVDFEFVQIDDDEKISILVDDTEDSKVVKTAAEWCVSNRKGFLCTENF